MPGFLQALHSYRNGSLSRQELLLEVDRQLASGEALPGTLLAQLGSEHNRERLPGEIHIELMRKLLRHRGRQQADAPAEPAVEQPRDLDDDTAIISTDGSHSAVGVLATAAPLRRKPAISVGRMLKGRFRLIEPIGEGGMSVVYRAIDLRKVEARAPNTHVAVKLLAVPTADFTHALQVLQAEAHKLQLLPHPNIVRVIDCDRDGRTVFMTMEHLNGESLKQKMTRQDFKGLPVPEALAIIGSIAAGLEFAHRNGIVHGDLKPGNVIVTDQGEIKIIDFGIARLMTRDPGATLAGDERPKLSALTPPYASPEMLEGARPDPRDDVYALACIAHELITGRHPFDRRVANEARDSGLRLVRHAPLAPAQFKAIARGLEFDREKRTQSAAQFFEELSATPGMRPETLGAIAAVVVLALLLGSYFVANDRILRWIQAHRNVSVLAPAPGEVFRDCPTCPLMKALPPGQFAQGSPDDARDSAAFEHPRHPVAIRYPLAMGVYEITVGEFREFATATGHVGAGCETYDGAWRLDAQLSWQNAGYTQSATHPVVCVSWQDAQAYVTWLSKKTGQKYRLPSESEWEYAARAGSDLPRPWGTDDAAACRSANVADQTAALQYPGWKVHPCSDGYVHTAPVGSFKPNALGLYDTLGNVFEWVQDCWHPDYQGAPTDGSAWLSGNCTERNMRGGSWFTAPALVATAARNRFEETHRSTSVGFRLAREIRP